MDPSSNLDFTTTEFNYVNKHTYKQYAKHKKIACVFITLFAVGIIASLAIFSASTFLSLKYIKTSKVIKSAILLKTLSILASTVPFLITSSGIFITSFISIGNRKRYDNSVQISLGTQDNPLSNDQIEKEIKKLNEYYSERPSIDDSEDGDEPNAILADLTDIKGEQILYHIRKNLSLIIYASEDLETVAISDLISKLKINKLIICGENITIGKNLNAELIRSNQFYHKISFDIILNEVNSIEEALNKKIPYQKDGWNKKTKRASGAIYIVKPNT